MEYFIIFLEGVITFISPCLLPMIPIYISFFAGGKSEENNKRTLVNAIAFSLGFTVVFVILGLFAGTVGRFLIEYHIIVNIVSGLIVIIFGLNFAGIVKIPFLNKTAKMDVEVKEADIISSLIFGLVFSIGWTPCVGAFLGSALMLASQQGSVLKGMLMLLVYSLGLAIPFIASAVLISKLKSTFDFIKRNYKVINVVCGIFLIVVGIMMMLGLLNRLLSLLSY